MQEDFQQKAAMESSNLSLITWTFLVVPVIAVLYRAVKYLWNIKKIANGISRFPNPNPYHWFLGHMVLDKTNERSEDMLSALRLWNKEHPEGINQFWVSIFIPSIYIRHPEIAKKIFKTAEPKPWTYRMNEPWLGDGLLLSSGNKWARNRRLMTPAFHFDILKPYMDIYNEASDILLEKMSGYAERNEVFDMYAHSALITLDVMLRCAMSYESDAQIQGEKHPYVKAVAELTDAPNARFFGQNPLMLFDTIFNVTAEGKKYKNNCNFVHKISNDIIKKRQVHLEEVGEKEFLSGKKHLDFLDILLTVRDEDGKGLSHEDIRAEVDTFLFEGHDTTASALGWTLYMLAKYPEHQKKCQEEVDRILEGRDTDQVQWNDLNGLKYTTMCLKESMRLNTTVPLIQRTLTKPLKINGNVLQPGTMVTLDLYAMSNHQDIWEYPESYMPERFVDVSTKDPFAFVPFSAGPRNCIGQNFALHELKVILTRVLRRFHLEVASPKFPRRQISAIMRAIGGLPIKLTPRE